MSNEIKEGGWVRIIKEGKHRNVHYKIGECHKVEKINSVRCLTITEDAVLFYSGKEKECEWIGMDKPSSDEIALSSILYTEWRIGDIIERFRDNSHPDISIGDHLVIHTINVPEKRVFGSILNTRMEDESWHVDNFKLVKRANQSTVQDDFVLPKKWYVESNVLEEKKIIGKWFDENGFSNHPFYEKDAFNNKKGYTNAYSAGNVYYTRCPAHVQEITFEQFQKYVLKQPLNKSNNLNKENHGTTPNSENQKSERFDESISRRETTERSNISFGGCGDGLETSNRKREVRSVEIGKRTGSEGEGLCPRRRSQRTLTI